MMRKSAMHFIVAFLFSFFATTAQAQQCESDCHHHGCNHDCKGNMPPELSKNVAPLTPAPDYIAFTGKVIKNKVRLRHQPNLDSPVLKELNHGDMLIVVGETEDFYAVQPPAGTKAYVFRTFVLDNVVEGNRVNVRLEPDVESPVIAQLSSGERIEGNLSPQNNKWIEIAPPSSTRFFIAKDYVEKLGDSAIMTTMEKRRAEANLLLNTTLLASQNEMRKSFPEIRLEEAYANYNKVINHYSEFTEQVARAHELLETLQDSYLQKKITYLEFKAKNAQEEWQSKNSQLSEQMKAQQQRLVQLEQQIKKEMPDKAAGLTVQNDKSAPSQLGTRGISSKMAAWLPAEETLYRNWAAQNENSSMEEFYLRQRREPILIKGIVEPYTRVIKNKPGDYVLISTANNLPIAFVYSTLINLQEYVGREVTLHLSHRPNNHFAFPAFFALSVE